MNKIKLLYDVVRTMRNKEALHGVLTAEAQKDKVSIFTIRNEFDKNLQTGRTKAKISTELDYEGKMVKHESNTEFTLPCSGEGKHCEFMKHMHGDYSAGCGGVKGILAKLAFALAILNALQAEEQESKSVVMTLNADDLAEDTKELLCEKMSRASSCGHGGHGFIKEFCSVDKLDFLLKMFINKKSEVEKILITFGGSNSDGQNEKHDLKAKAELSFSW
jgi:galactokinase/mevalonate kinase-like predicted kinase